MSSSSVSASVSVSGFSSPVAFSCYEPSIGSASPSYVDIVFDVHNDYFSSYQSCDSNLESALPESPSGRLSRGIDACELIHKLKKLIFPNEPELWFADFDYEPASLSSPSPSSPTLSVHELDSPPSSISAPDSEETFEVVEPSSGWETASDMSLETPAASPSLKGEELEVDEYGYLPKNLFEEDDVPLFASWASPTTYVEEIDMSPLDRISALVATPLPAFNFVVPDVEYADQDFYAPSWSSFGLFDWNQPLDVHTPRKAVVPESFDHIVADIHKIAERQLAAAGLLTGRA